MTQDKKKGPIQPEVNSV